MAHNQNGKRKVVVVIRDENGRTTPAIFRSGLASINFVKPRVEHETTLQADQGGSITKRLVRLRALARCRRGIFLPDASC